MLAVQQELPFSIPADHAVISAPSVVGITNMIADCVPTKELSRRIVLEMALILDKMTVPADQRPRGCNHRDLMAQIRALRELHRTVIDSVQSRNQDALDLDGEKFKFVYTQIVQLFQEALRLAGIDRHLAHNIMLQFADLVREREDEWRSELKKLTTGA